VSAALPEAVRAFVASRYGEAGAAVPLSGDASTRRYFRISCGGATAVLALHPEPFVPAELAFLEVRELLAGWGLPVPEVFEADGPQAILLLEDLGDRTLQQALDQGLGAARRLELYREALDQLVTLQREAERGPHAASCFRVAFDVEKLSWELHYFEKHFLEGLRGRSLGVEDRATLAQSFHRLAEEMASWPRVLCHRDFHSRNLMLNAGRLVWLDFQDARLGPSTYDLVSLLRDAYVELPDGLVSELVEEFRQRVAAGEARDAFRLRFELTTLQRTLKALGTFGYMASVRDNPVYLQYVPRTLAAARVELERHRELDALRRVLARHLEELS
jgi:hypothetical protein